MLEIPKLNPIPFTLSGKNESEDEFAFYKKYYQKYQNNDIIYLQFIKNALENGTPNIEIIKDGGGFISTTYTPSIYDDLISGYTVFDFGIDLIDFPGGFYKLKLTFNSEIYFSDWICIKQVQPYTRLISYFNFDNFQNVVFQTGTTFAIRVESQVYNALTPKSNDTIYENTFGQFSMLDSSPFDVFRLNIGGTKGIPDWLISIINRALSCNYIYLDNLLVTKEDGATLEATEEDNYNLRSWNINLAKAQNDYLYSESILTVNGEKIIDINVSEQKNTIKVKIQSTESWYLANQIPTWLQLSQISGTPGIIEILFNIDRNITITCRQTPLYFKTGVPSVVAIINLNQLAENDRRLMTEDGQPVVTEDGQVILIEDNI